MEDAIRETIVNILSDRRADNRGWIYRIDNPEDRVSYEQENEFIDKLLEVFR